MRILLSGGGTGGHVYPALSVAEALRVATPDIELLYIGTETGAERELVPQAGIPFRTIHAGQIRGKSPGRVALSLAQLCRGVLRAARMLRDFSPQAAFVTGGYASVPVALAAWLNRIPLVVFLPDVYPGWAVRLSTRLATQLATTTAGASDHLPPGKTAVTGYPLRPEFWQADRQSGRERLGLRDGPVLLISGASQGAQRINEAVLASLDDLLACAELVHLTGLRDEARVKQARARLPDNLQARYHVYGYLDGMAWAMAGADLAVLRSGASCLAEPPALGLPAILVPGTYAGGHQRQNAAFMQSQGAAVLLDESNLNQLALLAKQLLGSPTRLRAMSAAARELARPQAASALADLTLRAGGIPSPAVGAP